MNQFIVMTHTHEDHLPDPFDKINIVSLHELASATYIERHELEYITTQRLQRIISTFVSDVDAFRTMMLNNCSVIVGKAGLAFQLGPFYVNCTHLEIVTPKGLTDVVSDWLWRVDYYGIQIQDSQARSVRRFRNGVEKIIDMRKSSNPDLSITITKSRGLTAIYPIAFSVHTILFSFTAMDGYCIAYPKQLQRQLNLHRQGLVADGYDAQQDIDAFSRSGISMVQSHAEWTQGTAPNIYQCAIKWRHWGDVECLVGAFDLKANGGRRMRGMDSEILTTWRLGSQSKCVNCTCVNSAALSGETFELSDYLLHEATFWSVLSRGEDNIDEFDDLIELATATYAE
jgi:hypothetical protein